MDPALRDLDTLLQYLVKHNDEHAAEVMELASRAQALGKADAHEHLVKGVALMNQSNESLRAALAALEA